MFPKKKSAIYENNIDGYCRIAFSSSIGYKLGPIPYRVSSEAWDSIKREKAWQEYFLVSREAQDEAQGIIVWLHFFYRWLYLYGVR